MTSAHRTSTRNPRPMVLARIARSETAAGWALATPASGMIILFGLVPLAWTALLSFRHSDLLSPDEPFVGTANYKRLAHDPLFVQSVVHTIVYTALFVPLTIVCGVAVSYALNRRLRFITFYRTAAYLTMAVSTVSQAMVFMWLTDPSFGVVNYGLRAVGLPSQGFLSDPGQALYVVIAMAVWGWLGFAVIIYLAALQGIPEELLEAAAIDGATPFTRFRTIVLPLLAPATLFLVVWLTINAMQLFDLVYVSTKGGPLHATTTVVYYLFNLAFQQFDGGYAAAMACVLFLAVLAATAAQFRLSRRYVHYR
jgi:multiple sugar transport system permease protein